MAQWTQKWTPVEPRVERRGGQGVVVKVRETENPERLAALKFLHETNSMDRERRYRFHQEVGALRLLEGIGAPAILEDHTVEWPDPSNLLYCVMEWVEGCPLSEFRCKNEQRFESAVQITTILGKTLSRLHSIGIIHRDIKPDNIMLRHGDVTDAVLIDFGISWHADNRKAEDSDVRKHETSVAQELGNRFLRLPELSAGAKHRDARTDVTQLLGVFYFLLSGRAPRLLLDGNGLKPHERSPIDFKALKIDDAVARKVHRTFSHGFETTLDARIPDAKSLVQLVESLLQGNTTMNDDTEQHLNALHDLFNTPTRRSLEIASKSMEDAIEAFKNTVSRTIAPYGLNAGGSNGLEDGGRVARLTFFLLKRGLSEPKAHYKVMLKFDGTRITGSRHVEGQNWKDFFSGDIGTSSLLIEACESEAVIMAGELAQVLMKKFEDQ